MNAATRRVNRLHARRSAARRSHEFEQGRSPDRRALSLSMLMCGGLVLGPLIRQVRLARWKRAP